MKSTFYTLSVLLFLLISCDKKEAAPVSPIPVIAFKSISHGEWEFTPDLLYYTTLITLTYQDGDSDLGLNPEDRTLPPYQAHNNDGSPNKYFYNYFVKIYKKTNGIFQSQYYEPSLDGIFARIGNKGGIVKSGSGDPFAISTKSATEGELMRTFYFDENSGFKGDTFKLEITLVDRALNESNTIETPSFIIGQ